MGAADGESCVEISLRAKRCNASILYDCFVLALRVLSIGEGDDQS